MNYYKSDDIAKILHVSKSKAYKIMRQLNKELEDKGYLTVRGRVSKKFFKEKYYDYTE